MEGGQARQQQRHIIPAAAPVPIPLPSPLRPGDHPPPSPSLDTLSSENQAMGRRGQGSNPYISQSPVGKEPLLASAQGPGMSQRLSESSLASYEHGGPGKMPNSNSYGSFASLNGAGANGGGRFGPTAQISSSPNLKEMTKAPAVGPLSNGMEDDDDLDDNLHTFTAADRKSLNAPFDITSTRGWANALTLIFLATAALLLFAGYPILTFYYGDRSSSGTNTSGFNLGGINASGQYPEMNGLPRMIDPDTPQSARSRTGFDGNTWNLVFSDEFNVDGRTFFEGDDPFWQAVDIHYWPTGDFEWYDPSAATTRDGHLVLTMTQENIHDLNFKSGMIQSWNKLCFNRNAYFEFSCSMPGTSTVGGFWPGLWTMGNLGRPGYGATTEGTWPYTYDSCDIGTLPNQTWANGSAPDATLTTGSNGGPLSYLPGQKFSSCTCPGEDHPGPRNDVGRAAPEIDAVEAQIIIGEGRGEVSQSNQVAPFDDYYQFNNASNVVTQYDTSLTYFNTYLGGNFQQAVSSLTRVPRNIYYNQDRLGEQSKQFTTFGFEYVADFEHRENGYIAWTSDGKRSWTMLADATAANPRVGIGRRLVSEEPMTIIMNFGMSNNFQTVNFKDLIWPNYFRIDYVRVYQRADGEIGCDPDHHPTKDYIERHKEAYNNPNQTIWAHTGQPWPKNRLVNGC